MLAITLAVDNNFPDCVELLLSVTRCVCGGGGGRGVDRLVYRPLTSFQCIIASPEALGCRPEIRPSLVHLAASALLGAVTFSAHLASVSQIPSPFSACPTVDCLKLLLDPETCPVATVLHGYLDKEDEQGLTPAAAAAQAGSADALRFILDDARNGPRAQLVHTRRISFCDHNQNNLLHFAAMSGDVETTKYLIQHAPVQINSANKDFWTPVCCCDEGGGLGGGRPPARSYGFNPDSHSSHMPKALLRSRRRTRSLFGSTVGTQRAHFVWASFGWILTFTRKLPAHPPIPPPPNSDREGTTALHLAALNGSTECVKLLIKWNHPVDSLDVRRSHSTAHRFRPMPQLTLSSFLNQNSGWPPLLYADFQAKTDCVMALLAPKPEQLMCLSALLTSQRSEVCGFFFCF